MLAPDRPWNKAPFHAKASIRFAHWFDAGGEACQRERVLSSLRGHPVVSGAASTRCHHGKVFSDCLGLPPAGRNTANGYVPHFKPEFDRRQELPARTAGVSFSAGGGEVSANREEGVGRRFTRGGRRGSSRVARLCRFASPRPFRWLENRGEARNQRADSGQGQRMLDLLPQNVCPCQPPFGTLKNRNARPFNKGQGDRELADPRTRAKANLWQNGEWRLPDSR
jgi:hypothetical protein